MVCFDTPISRATSSARRPASTLHLLNRANDLRFRVGTPAHPLSPYLRPIIGRLVCGFRGEGQWRLSSRRRTTRFITWAAVRSTVALLRSSAASASQVKLISGVAMVKKIAAAPPGGGRSVIATSRRWSAPRRGRRGSASVGRNTD